LLEVVDVVKTYNGAPALKGVAVGLEAGEILGLLGPNGAGKTTLVSIIAGLRTPDSGSVRIAENDVLRNPTRARRLIALAPQELGIYPTITVRENLVYFGELSGLSRRALSERIDDVAELMHLTHLLAKRAHALSGGEKRRLHSAAAHLSRAPLILLDEPTAGADVRTRADILSVVKLLADGGSAVLYTTHYMSEVEALQASVAILDEGEIIAQGPLDRLLAKFGHSAVELVFEGPAPSLTIGQESVWVEDSSLRIMSDRPAAAAARAIGALGDETARLRYVEIIHANLESAFLSLTGRRYSEEGRDSHNLVC
jgi:ABC-2 type transport system ATP-binding protein